MSPLIFINGVIFASAAAITLGLLVTLLLVLMLGSESAALASESGPLSVSVLLFAVMTAVSGVSFLGVLRERRWRWPGVAAMWTVLALLVAYYWPA